METGILCLCVVTLMEEVRETAAALFSSPPSWAPLPSTSSPQICPTSICLPVHPFLGVPSPSLLQAPQGGKRSLRGCVGLYGFIYNILKKSKICMKISDYPPSLHSWLLPLFSCSKKKNKPTQYFVRDGEGRGEGVWRSH